MQYVALSLCDRQHVTPSYSFFFKVKLPVAPTYNRTETLLLHKIKLTKHLLTLGDAKTKYKQFKKHFIKHLIRNIFTKLISF